MSHGLKFEPRSVDNSLSARLSRVTGASTDTRSLYDGDQLIREHSGDGTLLHSYVHGSGVDDPLVWYENMNGSGRRFLHADEQGSIVAITENSGHIHTINRYDDDENQHHVGHGVFSSWHPRRDQAV